MANIGTSIAGGAAQIAKSGDGNSVFGYQDFATDSLPSGSERAAMALRHGMDSLEQCVGFGMGNSLFDDFGQHRFDLTFERHH